ncbi:MAG: MazG family protein [Puniceicoccaceae bacterium]
MERLKEVVERLRGPGGCPWDREQTHQTLAPCLVEECAEVLEAIDCGEASMLREELGDLLLSILMHATIASEGNHFTFEELAQEVTEKLIRRHPHVFGDQSEAISTSAVLKQWEEIKAGEKAAKGIPVGDPHFKDLPPSLPSTLWAEDIYKRLQRHRLTAGCLDQSVVQERAEGLTEEVAGRALFEWVAACREAGIDSEGALRRFANRVRREARSGD